MDPTFDPAALEPGGRLLVVQDQRVVIMRKAEDPSPSAPRQITHRSSSENLAAKLFGHRARDLYRAFAHYNEQVMRPIAER
jgi:hypothetical protein